MGEKFLRETPRYSPWFVPSPQFIEAYMLELIMRQQQQGDVLLVVIGGDDDAHGMLAAIANRHPHTGQPMAAELFWWVDPERRGCGAALYRGFMRWSKNIGAELIQMTANSKKVGRIYKRLGFAPLEEVYIRKVS
jgi:hypothetical protein